MIQNRSGERPYMNDRLVVDRDGYKVIYMSDAASIIPWTCELCDVVMRSQEDEESHVKFGCCSNCAIRWAYPNVEKWMSGWRPTKEDATAQDRLVSTLLTF